MVVEPNRQTDFSQEPEAALRALSASRGISAERLFILDEAQVDLPHQKTTLKLYKILDPETKTSQRVALDVDNNVVDLDEFLTREREIEYDRYGSMMPELHRLVEMGQAPTIPVVIKYAVPEESFDKSEIRLSQKQELSGYLTEMANQVQQQAADMFRETMGQFDLKAAEDVRPSGPFVSAELPPEVIQRLSKDPRVAFIGLDKEKVVRDYPTIEESLPTTRTQFVHSSGIKGSGIKIAVLEDGGLAVNQACFNIGDVQDSTQPADWHMTKSVGIIGNRYNNGQCNGDWQGYAPEAKVYVANDTDYKDAYEWAKGKSVEVITMSWHYTTEQTSGSLHSRDIYFDYMVTHYPWPTIFVSAGNQAASGAYASGKGYNFFGVANVLNDGDGNRCNDVIDPSSSWKNPTSTHGDRELPEIAAPGSRHALLGTSFGGTSCATPVAASIAALLMCKNNNLMIWPEAIRAIMLATANYQDADGADWSKYSDGKDGTGLINTLYAFWTAGRRETSSAAQYRAHDYGTMRASDFSGGYFSKTWKAKTYTTQSRIRVALTWNSKTAASGGSPTSSVLDADLDLKVYDPDGNLVAWSTSWDGNYEFVEFAPSKTGEYEIKVRGYSVPSDFWSYYGIAWTTHYDLCS